MLPIRQLAALILSVLIALPAPALAQQSRAQQQPQMSVRPPVDNRIDARGVFATFQQAHPKVWRESIQAARARGWKPTEAFEGYKERGAPGRIRKRPVTLSPAQDEYMAGWDGDISIWYWDDGNPDNVEYWIVTRSYETGEDLLTEGSFRAWSDDDGWNDWFDVRGGSRWDRLGERERQALRDRIGIVLVGGFQGGATAAQRQCQKQCLSQKMRNVVKTAAWATGASIVGCGRAAAFSGPGFGVTFFGCVGVGALLGTGAGLVSQFMISSDCKTQCGG